MSKYRIKETGSGLYIVLELKDVGGGYCWNDTGRKFESKEAAQAYIDEMRGADGHRRNNLYKVRG